MHTTYTQDKKVISTKGITWCVRPKCLVAECLARRQLCASALVLPSVLHCHAKAYINVYVCVYIYVYVYVRMHV